MFRMPVSCGSRIIERVLIGSIQESKKRSPDRAAHAYAQVAAQRSTTPGYGPIRQVGA
ncbi:hypothetical protein RSAG8_07172, partial [Rhizoctonia solani AG-8 WAC10335]